MKITIKNLFDYTPGNHGLTEEVIYFYQADTPENAVPVYSGSASNDKPIAMISRTAKNNKGMSLVYFHGPCLILTKDGSAGLLTYMGPEKGNFTINHHACVLRLKPDYEGKVNLNWFEFQYKSLFYKYVSSKSDNGVFSIEWFDRIKVDIPDIEIQLENLSRRGTISDAKHQLLRINESAKSLLEKETIPQANGEVTTVGAVFNFFGGNSGLIEELIYNNQAYDTGSSIKVLSGATSDTNSLGEINADVLIGQRKLKTFESPGIVVIRKGVAGKMQLISNGKFTINDDAYVMKVRKNWERRVNPAWFMCQYQSLFFNIVTSRSDNGTFSKGYASRQTIKVPALDYQNKVAERYLLLKRISAGINGLNRKINSSLYAEMHSEVAAK